MKLSELASIESPDEAKLKRELRDRVADVKTLLGQNTTQARQMLRKLLACSKIEMEGSASANIANTAFVSPTRALLRNGLTASGARVSARVSSSRMPRRATRLLAESESASRRLELV